MKKKASKVVSVILTVLLLFSVSVTPVAAGQENGRGRRNVPTPEIQHLDAGVRVIAGQPVITVETKRGHVDIPFVLPDVFLVDGQTIPLQLQGNGVVVPTEDGSVVVPLEEFEVVVANGQAMLVAEVNPIPIIVAGAVLGGLAGIGTGAAAVAGLKSVGVIVGASVAKTIVATGGVAGAIVGGAAVSR